MTSRSLLAAAVPVLLVLPLAGTATAAPMAAQTPTCLGRPATVVGPGTPGGSDRLLVGTEGDDVIVTNGSSRVDALGGDDAVCVTGPDGGDGLAVAVSAGPGDDAVRVTGDQDTSVTLGGGEDTFVGGAGADSVTAGGWVDADNTRGYRDLDRDVIDTGAGADSVRVGDPSIPLADEVRVERGYVKVESTTATEQAVLDGGTGPSSLTHLGANATRWRLDAEAGRASVGDVPAFSWTGGFHEFQWSGTVDFRGSAADEIVIGALHTADMGAGDDAVFPSVPEGLEPGRVSGGDGEDHITWGLDDRPTTLDLAGSASTDGGTLAYDGFEVVGIRGVGPFTILGTDGDDVLESASTCRATVRLGAGDDVLGLHADYNEDGMDCPRLPSPLFDVDTGPGDDRVDGLGYARLVLGPGDDVARTYTGDDVVLGGPGADRIEVGKGEDQVGGGSGNDVVLGGDGSDRLDGGPGRDQLQGDGADDAADGGDGRDRCQAEVRRGCETRGPVTARSA